LKDVFILNTGVSACEHGFYGVGCQQRCRCDNDASCDAETGACACPAGRTGPHCQQRMYHNAVTRNLHRGECCSLIPSAPFHPFISPPLLPLFLSFPRREMSPQIQLRDLKGAVSCQAGRVGEGPALSSFSLTG